MSISIGSRIRLLRRQNHFTQEALAERLHVSSQAVSKWENDLSYPDITLLTPLSRLLGVTTDALLSDEFCLYAPSPATQIEARGMLLRDPDGSYTYIRLPAKAVQEAVKPLLQLSEVRGSGGGEPMALTVVLAPVR